MSKRPETLLGFHVGFEILMVLLSLGAATYLAVGWCSTQARLAESPFSSRCGSTTNDSKGRIALPIYSKDRRTGWPMDLDDLMYRQVSPLSNQSG